RMQYQASLGRDAQRFYLGGPGSIPGYDYRTMAGLRSATMTQELRFPLLSGLTLAVPASFTLPTVSGGAFGTMSWAWDEGSGIAPENGLTDTGVLAPVQGHLGSVGAGFF